MRALWVDEGNNPHYAACERHRIDTLFFALRDPRVTRAYLEEVRSRGYQVGVYAAWNWPGYQGSGRAFAEAVAQRLAPLRVSNTLPRVQLNDETQSPSRIVELLARWRALYPYQATSWTLEGMQGGWFTTELVAAIVSARVRVVPQCYDGAMTQAWDTLAVARDLTRRGVPDSIISPFYDAARLPEYWRGFAFTQGRLP